jgi:hypothetical protein
MTIIDSAFENTGDAKKAAGQIQKKGLGDVKIEKERKGYKTLSMLLGTTIGAIAGFVLTFIFSIAIFDYSEDWVGLLSSINLILWTLIGTLVGGFFGLVFATEGKIGYVSSSAELEKPESSMKIKTHPDKETKTREILVKNRALSIK